MFDIFGKRDPRKTPSHFFSGALHLDYSTAVRADVSKQNYSVCPRHWYIEASYQCDRCRETFNFSREEQRFWYEELNFWIDSQPRHCGACRWQQRELAALRQCYDKSITVTLCSQTSVERKIEILSVISALEEGGIVLPAKMLINRDRLMKQVQQKIPPAESR